MFRLWVAIGRASSVGVARGQDGSFDAKAQRTPRGWLLIPVVLRICNSDRVRMEGESGGNAEGAEDGEFGGLGSARSAGWTIGRGLDSRLRGNDGKARE